ncbi:hypothetical protein RB195_019629 [Necator americanus]|uniref:Secreted protein n=1 Tax=Necator americanus TaxID=51031 RepID=A0ABR1CF19_NECAM
MGSTFYGDQWTPARPGWLFVLIFFQKTPPRIHGKIQATIIKITNNNTTDGSKRPQYGSSVGAKNVTKKS